MTCSRHWRKCLTADFRIPWMEGILPSARAGRPRSQGEGLCKKRRGYSRETHEQLRKPKIA